MFKTILRSQRFRNFIPRRMKILFAENRSRLVRVKHHTSAQNIYHCCVHKTGSQWIRRIFSDLRTYQYSGLRSYNYASHSPIAFQINILASRPDRFWKPVRSENFYFSEKL